MDIEQNISGIYNFVLPSFISHIADKLSFAFLSHKKHPEGSVVGDKFYLNVEDIFNILYIPFKYDFVCPYFFLKLDVFVHSLCQGPPSLGTIYLFSKVMTLRLQKQVF